MDKRTTLCMLLAGALGYGSGHMDDIVKLLDGITSYVQIVAPPTTLAQAMDREESKDLKTKSQETAKAPPRSEDGNLSKVLTKASTPTYITDTIDFVRFTYIDERTRHTFHYGLSKILEDFPYCEEIQERCQRMRHLENVLYSTSFGLTGPERLGGTSVIPGDPVMDIDRAIRIKDHAFAKHGKIRPYDPQDPCLSYFHIIPKTPGTMSEQEDSAMIRRMRQRASPHHNHRRTINDAAVYWLGGKPSSELRPMTPEERSIGN